MTSTPRSTLPWRTSRKNRAPTSLSLIVAKPEVASPLASAVTFLPPVKMPGDADVKAAPVIAVEGLHPPVTNLADMKILIGPPRFRETGKHGDTAARQ
jgi:hypothetical protein